MGERLKIGASTGIFTATSQIASLPGGLQASFIDMLQVSKGKVAFILGGSISVSNAAAGGVSPVIGICDQSFNFGGGPQLEGNSGKIDPQSLGVVLQVEAIINPGDVTPFNDDFDFSSEGLAIPEGFFVRIASSLGAPNANPFSAKILYALLDVCSFGQ